VVTTPTRRAERRSAARLHRLPYVGPHPRLDVDDFVEEAVALQHLRVADVDHQVCSPAEVEVDVAGPVARVPGDRSTSQPVFSSISPARSGAILFSPSGT